MNRTIEMIESFISRRNSTCGWKIKVISKATSGAGAVSPAAPVQLRAERGASSSSVMGMVAMAIALPPPSINEVRLESDMFVTRLTFEFRVAHCEPRVSDLLDYTAEELTGKNLYTLCHGQDVQKLRKCHVDLINKGQVMSAYYRLMNKNGGFTWLQTCATVICNSKNSDEQSIICVNYVLSGIEYEHCILDCSQMPDNLKPDDPSHSERSRRRKPETTLPHATAAALQVHLRRKRKFQNTQGSLRAGGELHLANLCPQQAMQVELSQNGFEMEAKQLIRYPDSKHACLETPLAPRSAAWWAIRAGRAPWTAWTSAPPPPPARGRQDRPALEALPPRLLRIARGIDRHVRQGVGGRDEQAPALGGRQGAPEVHHPVDRGPPDTLPASSLLRQIYGPTPPASGDPYPDQGQFMLSGNVIAATGYSGGGGSYMDAYSAMTPPASVSPQDHPGISETAAFSEAAAAAAAAAIPTCTTLPARGGAAAPQAAGLRAPRRPGRLRPPAAPQSSSTPAASTSTTLPARLLIILPTGRPGTRNRTHNLPARRTRRSCTTQASTNPAPVASEGCRLPPTTRKGLLLRHTRREETGRRPQDSKRHSFEVTATLPTPIVKVVEFSVGSPRRQQKKKDTLLK
ncbi:protein trachealess [Caerostris extrusa]|uniref:Protein trachealess n=1 Tax=Caerostris extrusa TaxID=172846 RepID=A0AAV4M7L3_CAEEX|nr:protein trachealess [Caerostris extrusa]